MLSFGFCQVGFGVVFHYAAAGMAVGWGVFKVVLRRDFVVFGPFPGDVLHDSSKERV